MFNVLYPIKTEWCRSVNGLMAAEISMIAICGLSCLELRQLLPGNNIAAWEQHCDLSRACEFHHRAVTYPSGFEFVQTVMKNTQDMVKGWLSLPLIILCVYVLWLWTHLDSLNQYRDISTCCFKCTLVKQLRYLSAKLFCTVKKFLLFCCFLFRLTSCLRKVPLFRKTVYCSTGWGMCRVSPR